MNQTHSFEGSPVRLLAFPQEGAWAAAGDLKGKVWASDVEEGKLDNLLFYDRVFSPADDPTNPVKSLAWNPTGQGLLSYDSEGLLRIWQKDSGNELFHIQGPVEGASGLSWPSPEEALLTVAGEEGPEIWRIHIPPQLLQQAVERQEQAKAAALKAQEEARRRAAKAAEEAQAKAAKVAEAKRLADLEAQKKGRQTILPTLKGQVVDAFTNKPLEGVEIALPKFGVVLHTTSAGQFEYSSQEIGNTIIRLSLFKEGYEKWEAQVKVGAAHIIKMPRLEQRSQQAVVGEPPPTQAVPQGQGLVGQDSNAESSQAIPQGVQQVEPQQSPSQQPAAPQRVNRPSPITGKDGAVMVLVAAGEFMMGAREDDKEAAKDERPAHQVYLDAFYIDQYEVTTSRYATFFQEMKRNPPEYWSESVLKRHGNKPVVGVTWEDANAYCVWAGKKLPTEAEWEKAARGTDGRLYPWGQEPPNEQLANFNQGFDFKDYGVLTDVGSFESGKSPYGAYDMAGNAWEWVADWYDETLYQQRATGKEPVRNPQGPDKGEFKVLRGGSWSDFEAGNLRSANRFGNNPSSRFYDLGFRCAQGAP